MASAPRRVHVNAAYAGTARSGSALTRVCPVDTCEAGIGMSCRKRSTDGFTWKRLVKPHPERRAKNKRRA